jgi:anti-sigma-K factor RskA
MADKMDILIDAYASGQALSPAERDTVEQALGASAQANEQLAAEYRLTDLLRSAPVPQVNYDLLARQISAALPGEAPTAADRRGSTAHAAFWSRSRSILAIAASVLIVAGVAIPLLNRPSGAPQTNSIATGPQPITIRAIDSGGTIASAPAGIQNVAIGPSPALAKSAVHQSGYAQINNQRPAQVVISGDSTPNDGGLLEPR